MKQWIEGTLAFCSLYKFELISLVRLLLAALCGGFIGLERNMKGRPAGLKTFSLVCLGSALVMITNEFIVVYIGNETGDLSRMAAQVISGVGFLGAGSIMVTGNNRVIGLTTAATLWVTAAIGIALGTGFYFGGIGCMVLIQIFSRGFRLLDKKLMETSRIAKIYVEGHDEEFMLRLFDYFEKSEIKVLGLQRREDNKWYRDDTAAVIEMDFGKKKTHGAVLEEISQIEGFRCLNAI